MANILVVGSMNMDIVTRVRCLPVPGETIQGLGTGFHAGGKGANQACAASRLGATVTMAGGLGSDAFGRQMYSQLEAEGIDTSAIAVKQETSGIALITTDAMGENSIILSPGANFTYSAADLEALDFSRYDVILLQNEIAGSVNEAVLTRAEEAGVPVCMNPAPVNGFEPGRLSRIRLLIVNETEAEALSGLPVESFAGARTAGYQLMEEGITQLIITLGSKGSLYMDADGTVIETPSYPVKAVDTTAAGDTFIGAFAATYYGGMELEDSLHYASAAAALAVSAAGAQSSIPVKEQVDAFLGQAES
ncbi:MULTISPECIES: ribokinase [unclassified Paenibacillus]|uniref:ribokinase n=1 Tax=unclassified Paenibacillus TaxID=185978 RepID=UPI002406DF1A|nr:MULTISPECIES: ribokinase [unclassified Paenibacillus]MDF9842594.1 ribokinase [Paenibacillus sp. PastF-2]MDF9849199.1 ribokinase [Paenibacillus sp. PastM-2]MDF9855754.1 ribokinase [Paenibacillus sp. PastF-1]MDH6481042.1 ribokinase [Paenibacillus sp. PastH-2]MDH6508446.1 ribokinase [Paenibacillus sp. PastM-3]